MLAMLVFVLLKFENKLDPVVSHNNNKLLCHNLFHFIFKLVQVLAISIIFSLKSTPKYQCFPFLCIMGKLDYPRMTRVREESRTYKFGISIQPLIL